MSNEENQKPKRRKWQPLRTWTDDDIEKEAKAFEEWLENPENINVEDFALERGYHPKMLMIMSKRSSEFSELMQIGKRVIESGMVRKGLHSEYNAKILERVLSRWYGWVDDDTKKADNELTTHLKANLASKTIEEDEGSAES